MKKLKSIALGGVIAALYAALTVGLAPLSYGALQFRVSEALTLLPFYLPEAVPGLFVGCLVANFFGNGLLDVVVGSAATLIAAWLSQKMPWLWLAAVPPVVVNMFLVGAMLHFALELPFWSSCLYVGLGQLGACGLLGLPLMKALEKRGLLKRRGRRP
jgi:uncharacterized membrane protein